jgi:hypothetical protein
MRQLAGKKNARTFLVFAGAGVQKHHNKPGQGRFIQKKCGGRTAGR